MMGRLWMDDKVSEGSISIEKSCLSVDRTLLLHAADKAGVLKLSAPKLAAVAGVSVQCAWKWARGVRVRQSSHDKILKGLGLA
jgi:DNA-binding transcriptional regulator YiaG